MCSVTQLCPTLCDPMDCSTPGSSVHGFSRQQYWSGLPFPSPGDLPHQGIKHGSLFHDIDILLFFNKNLNYEIFENIKVENI